MQQHMEAWLAPPVFPMDEAQTRRASLLNTALINILTLMPVLIIGNVLGGRTPLPVFIANAAAVALGLVLRGWMRRGRVQQAGVGLLAMGLILITASAASLGTIRAPTTAMYLLLVITAGLLFDRRGMLAMTAVCALAIGGLIVAENAGALPRPNTTVTITQWVAYTALCGWAGSLTLSALRALRQALARADQERIERQRVEGALQESEDRYRTLFNNSLDAILLTAPDGRILAANPAACQMFERSEAEICRGGRDGIVDTSDPRLAAGLAERARTGRFRGELTYIRQDGTRFPGEVSTVIFRDQNGEERTSMIIRDSAERTRTQQALQESEARFRRLFAEAPLAYQSLDAAGCLIDVNQAWLDLLGYARDEVLGRGFRDFLAPHELAAFDERFARFKATGAVSVELDMRHRTGATILAHVTGRTTHDEQGQFKQTHCILQDITERKRMERRLHEQQAQLSAVLENSNASVWAVDRDYRLILGNKVFYRECRAGFGRGIAEGESVLLDFLAPAEKEEWKGYYNRALQGESYRFERARRYSPTPLWNEYHLGPIRDETGTCVGATILAHDITERKRAEAEIQRRAEELAALNVIGRQASGSLDLAQVIAATLEGTIAAARPDAAFLFLREGERLLLRGVAPESAQAWLKVPEHRLGACLCGLALQTGRPLYTPDIHCDARCTWEECKNAGLRSLAALPLRSGEGIIGVIGLASATQRDFQLRAEFLETLALQAASSIQNARLFADVQGHVRELEAFYETSLELTGLRDTPVICQNVLDALERLLHYRRGAIVLRDETTNELQLVAHASMGLDGEVLQAELERVRGFFRLPQGITNWVAEHGQPVRIGDVRRDPRYLDADPAIQSEMAVPLIAGGRAIGAINVESELPDAFSAHDERLLATLANQLVIAVENARLYQEMERRQAQLSELTAYLQSAREEERAYVAREIHDEFGQSLTALKMDLSWLTKRLPEGRPDLAAKVHAMTGLVDAAVSTVRRIATELRPGLLDDLGLVAAIEWQAQEFARRTGLAVDLRVGEQDVALDSQLATALFRIFQETLTNVARHAQATRVAVALDDQPDRVTLVMADNGQGIAPAQIFDSRALGLLGMRERAHALGGDLTITSSPGQGTTVTARIPRRDIRQDL